MTNYSVVVMNCGKKHMVPRSKEELITWLDNADELSIMHFKNFSIPALDISFIEVAEQPVSEEVITEEEFDQVFDALKSVMTGKAYPSHPMSNAITAAKYIIEHYRNMPIWSPGSEEELIIRPDKIHQLDSEGIALQTLPKGTKVLNPFETAEMLSESYDGTINCFPAYYKGSEVLRSISILAEESNKKPLLHGEFTDRRKS